MQGLEVDAKAMRRNIEMTGGLVMSEAVKMDLGRVMGASVRTTSSTNCVASRSRRAGR